MKATIEGLADTRQVWVNQEILTPDASQKIRNHSPDGFAWGYNGSGPAQLALAILMKLFSVEIAQKNYQQFKEKYIGSLDMQKDFCNVILFNDQAEIIEIT